MSKSARTQRHYEKAFRGQGKLTGFGFKALQYDPRLQSPSGPGPSSSSNLNLDQLDRAAQPPPRLQESLQDSRKRSASVLSDPSMDRDLRSDSEVSDAQNLDMIDESPRSENENRSEISDLDPVIAGGDHDEEIEDWEAELEEVVGGPKSHVRDWADLRTDIKKHLKKHSKTLPLLRLNQLMIICNFATLRLKGLSRTQASIKIAHQWHEGQVIGLPGVYVHLLAIIKFSRNSQLRSVGEILGPGCMMSQ